MWVKLDDGFFDHPKVMAAGPRATTLYLAGLTYAARYLTDGFIPAGQIKVLLAKSGAKPADVTALLSVNLWHLAEGGYTVHDWADYNPSAEKVQDDRQWNVQRRALYSDAALMDLVRKRDAGCCRYCGKAVNFKDRRGPDGGTYDHIIPRGPNSAENVVIACRGCNASKGPRTPEDARMRLLPPPAPTDPPEGTKPGTKSELNPIQPPVPVPVPVPVPDQQELTAPPTPPPPSAPSERQRLVREWYALTGARRLNPAQEAKLYAVATTTAERGEPGTLTEMMRYAAEHATASPWSFFLRLVEAYDRGDPWRRPALTVVPGGGKPKRQAHDDLARDLTEAEWDEELLKARAINKNIALPPHLEAVWQARQQQRAVS